MWLWTKPEPEIESVCEIGGDLHPRDPRREIGEARVPAIAEAIGEACTLDVIVHEVNVVAGNRSSEEFHEAAVVAPANDGEAVTEFRDVHLAAEFSLENDDVSVANGASPGRGGELVVAGEISGGG